MRDTFRNVQFRRTPSRPPAHGLSADVAAIDVITDALITP